MRHDKVAESLGRQQRQRIEVNLYDLAIEACGGLAGIVSANLCALRAVVKSDAIVTGARNRSEGRQELFAKRLDVSLYLSHVSAASGDARLVIGSGRSVVVIHPFLDPTGRKFREAVEARTPLAPLDLTSMVD